MNKRILIPIVAVIIIATAACFYFQPSKQKLEQERIANITSKGDSVIMVEFLKGDTALRTYALESAENYTREVFFLNPDRNARTLEMIKTSFRVMEVILGVDSLANTVYCQNEFNEYEFSEIESGERWNKRTDQLMILLSESLKQKIKKIVLDKKEDPYWVHKYVSMEAMKDLLLSNHFGSEKTRHFIPRCCDSVLILDVAKTVPDSSIIVFQIGNVISKQRRVKIASKLPLDNAYNFFLESGISKEEIGKLVLARISETDGYDLLFYFAINYLTESQVINELRRKSTQKLVADFPSRTNVNIWAFPYETFSKYVITSVKNIDDYRLAVEFFKLTTSDSEQEVWIEILKKKSSI